MKALMAKGRSGLSALSFAVTGISSPVAWAQEISPLSFVVGTSITRDSNLFRRPSSLAVSDTITSSYVGLRVDKPYAQQRFQLELTENVSRYDKSSYLNFDALNYRGAWLWHFTPWISGTLSTSRTKALAPYEDTLGTTQRNIRVTENQVFTLDGWISGGWHILLGVTQASQKSQQLTQFSPDFKSVSHEFGIRYLARSGNSVSAIRRMTNGEYQGQSIFPTAANGDYRQNESELRGEWRLSGKSTVSGNLTWLERQNEDAVRRDFSGLATNIAYTWTPTGKLTLAFLASRSTSPIEDVNFSHTVRDSFSVGPNWRLSEKTSVRLRLGHTSTSYRGTGPIPALGPAREDKLRDAELGLDWSAMRSLSIRTSLVRQLRSSNAPGLDFGVTTAQINAVLNF